MKSNIVDEARSETGSPSDNSRRQFCQAAALGALALFLQSCGGGSSTSPSGTSSLTVLSGTPGTGSITLPIGSGSPLATVGGMALVQAGGSSVLVARTGQDSFAAVTAICTHQGCQITDYSGSVYVCPCHGSQFSTSGQVLTGPASVALQSFTTQFSNGTLTITG
jgi:cytochrome b6-f complex iron-sulfur subunit